MKTSIDKLEEQKATQEAEYQRRDAKARFHMRLISAYLRELWCTPAKHGKNNCLLAARIAQIDGTPVLNRLEPPPPFKSVTFLDGHGYCQFCLGANANGLRVSSDTLQTSGRPISEDEAMLKLTEWCVQQGVCGDSLRNAELAARRKVLGVIPVEATANKALQEAKNEAGREKHTIVALAVEIAHDSRFQKLVDLNYEINERFSDLEFWILGLAEAVEARFTQAWQEEERDFIQDIETLGCLALQLSLERKELVSADVLIQALLPPQDELAQTRKALYELLRLVTGTRNEWIEGNHGNVGGLLTGDVLIEAVATATQLLSVEGATSHAD